MESVVHASFHERIEVEVQRNRCKVFNLIPQCSLTCTVRLQREINPQPNLTKWLVDARTTQHIITFNKCIAVVDGSFFPTYPEFISTHWKFVYKNKVIDHGGFVVKVQIHLQSAYAAEVYSRLGVLTSIKQIMIQHSQNNKIDLMLGSDC